MQSVEQILQQSGTPVTTEVLDQTNTKVHWKQCVTCLAIKPHKQFRADSSYREGVRDRCETCEASPRLSTVEHTLRLRESNYYRQETRSQRGTHVLDFVDEAPRWGRMMHAFGSDGFLRRLEDLVGPSGYRLIWTEGAVVGDLAIYRMQRPYQDPEYLGLYIPFNYTMPEFGIMEFDSRDVPVREKFRGWRTILLRLIKAGFFTEEACERVFGEPSTEASTRWRREMFIMRNGYDPDTLTFSSPA